LEIGSWLNKTATGVTAFYDIDTPVTVAAVEQGRCRYMDRELMPQFGLYLSFTGGPILNRLERVFHVQRARAFYCAADPSTHFPEPVEKLYDFGYLGTYSADRQPALEKLLIAPARLWPEGRFIVAGPQFPASIVWGANLERITHLAPDKHRAFYNRQRFTLNITRADMLRSGFAPSVRLFEAAACGTPIITDAWEGLEDFFEPGREVFVVNSTDEVLAILRDMPESEARSLGERARQRVLAEHTAAHRAVELELHIAEARVAGLTC
jgi:spore maturation protein CgeB